MNQKKLILILLLSIFFVNLPVFSYSEQSEKTYEEESDNDEKFEIGIKGQIGGVSMDRNLQNDFKVQLGYGLGMSLNYDFSSQVGVELDLFLSVKGADTSNLESISVNYFSFPLLFRFDPFKVGLFFSAGLQANILISAKLEDRLGNSLEISSQFEEVYFDSVFGLGYRSNQLSFEVRYEYGITDMTKDNGYFGSYMVRNQSVFFLMGLNFKL